jgi:RNA polymerase sigma-70 factor (ECF subfamily)
VTDERAENDADLALVRAALAGNADGRRTLVERLLPVIRSQVARTLYRYKGRAPATQVLDDLSQQVFLALFEDGGRRLSAWSPERGLSLTSFVGLIAAREVVATLRRTRRNPWTERPTDDVELAGHRDPATDHEARLADRELVDRVLDRALLTLDERELILFQRLILDEASADVVAREMTTTVTALYKWRSRFTQLVRALGRELSGEPTRLSPALRELSATTGGTSRISSVPSAEWRVR